jgi:hypothetical protein
MSRFYMGPNLKPRGEAPMARAKEFPRQGEAG